MPKKEQNNYAFIDGANLHKGIEELGWKLDYRRFRRFLREKHHVGHAYLFIGLLQKNARLYKSLQDYGYILVFKQTVVGAEGKIKGNCDAELVLQATIDCYEEKYEKAIIITGDGDFACLVSFLQKRGKLGSVLSPSHQKCSLLLKQTGSKITFLEELQGRLEYKKRG